MPRVRCPDCFREFEVSRDDLSVVIECAACAARFGPLLPTGKPTGSPPPAPSLPPETADYSDRNLPQARPKRFKPKPQARVWPVLLGIALGLGGTAALAASVYLAVKYASQGPPPASKSR